MGERPKIVIVGAGFGGLAAAKKLGKVNADVTVIDSANHHLFQPLLYQIATATLSPADVAMPIRHVLRKQCNTEVLLGNVTGIDHTQKLVQLDNEQPVPYDYLVLATGSTHSYFGHPEWAKMARGLKTIPDATTLRSQILGAFEQAEAEPDEKIKQLWLTFILVGGGPTGVEMAGAISEISNRALTGEFRRIEPSKAKIILVEGGKAVLSTYDEPLPTRAKTSLEHRGVEVRLNTIVQGIDADGVDTNQGRIDGKTVIWTAGVKPSPAALWLDVEPDKVGRVKVGAHLSVPERDGVYVIGDTAYLEQDGKPLPGVAQVAIQQGKFVAAELIAKIEGNPFNKKFRYGDLGSLATIGRKSAVAQLGKVKLSGFIAWFIWLFVHIMNLVGFRAKLSVLMQWAWSYFTWDHGARLITQDWEKRGD